MNLLLSVLGSVSPRLLLAFEEFDGGYQTLKKLYIKHRWQKSRNRYRLIFKKSVNKP